MSIKKEDFQVYDKHLGNDGGAYKKLGKGTWYNDEMYQEALKQGQKLTTPVDVENKELPVYKVVFNEGSDDGVTSINLTKTPLFNAKQTNEHLRSSCDWCNPPQHQ